MRKDCLQPPADWVGSTYRQTIFTSVGLRRLSQGVQGLSSLATPESVLSFTDGESLIVDVGHHS